MQQFAIILILASCVSAQYAIWDTVSTICSNDYRREATLSISSGLRPGSVPISLHLSNRILQSHSGLSLVLVKLISGLMIRRRFNPSGDLAVLSVRFSDDQQWSFVSKSRLADSSALTLNNLKVSVNQPPTLKSAEHYIWFWFWLFLLLPHCSKSRNSASYRSLLNYLFNPTDDMNAAGFSYMRIPLGASDFSASGESWLHLVSFGFIPDLFW